MRVIDLKELRKDVRSIVSGCNCSLEGSEKGEVNVTVCGSIEDRGDNAENFVDLFYDTFGEKYRNECLWDTDESVGEGLIVVNTSDYDLVLDGSSVIECIKSFNMDSKVIIKEFKNMLISVFKCLDMIDTDGDIRKSVSIRKAGNCIKVEICFCDTDSLEEFHDTWEGYMYCMNHEDLYKVSGTLSDLMYIFSTDEDGLVIPEKVSNGYRLTGYIVVNEE